MIGQLAAWLAAPALAIALAPGSGDAMPHKSEPPFVAQVSRVTPGEVRYLWHPGCPVPISALRMIHMRYWGFDDRPHLGWMIVNTAVTGQVLTVFSKLYDERFPIEKMVTEEAYHGSDPASMAADNSSGFNCRDAVAPGPPQWSVHAYGEAIDVNTVQNPYIEGGVVQPAAGAAYTDRADVRPGMAVPGGELVQAFASVGWYWGGRWTSSPDYQHFSLTGG
jgi:D-alanyl-D-alanine carboxypeptidase